MPRTCLGQAQDDPSMAKPKRHGSRYGHIRTPSFSIARLLENIAKVKIGEADRQNRIYPEGANAQTHTNKPQFFSERECLNCNHSA